MTRRTLAASADGRESFRLAGWPSGEIGCVKTGSIYRFLIALFYETAIWDNPDTTYMLKGGCAFCLAKRTIFGNVLNLLGCQPHRPVATSLLTGGFDAKD
jgi:hypothetical protein